ncbi:reverse transcriptase domain-containing protein [Tanacetum coccineum]
MGFHQMDTEEVSDRFVAPCFVNGLEAYDREINLGVKENMILNEYAVKLYLEHEFIINPEEDDVEPGVILGRSFLRLTKAITDFKAGTVTIYPEFDPFLEDIEEEEKIGGHLIQKEAAKEALAIRISQKFVLLEEVRLVIETMAYHDKYKKILDEIWKDKVELDGKIVKEEEEAVKWIKGEALKEKDDSGAFIFPIRLEGKVNKNALPDTGSDINTMSYRIYETLGREDMKKVDRGITIINHTQAEAMGILTNVLCQLGFTTLIAKFLILDIPINRDAPIVVGRGLLCMIGGIVNTPKRLFLTFDGFCHQTFQASRSDVMRNIESNSDDEEEYHIKRNNVRKKAVSFLGSLPIPLKHVNWKPDYKGSYTKEEGATAQWRTEIRLTDTYGNIYLQGFTTKKTDRTLSKYHKLSDIMSPNWFTMGTHDDEAESSRSKRSRQYETVEEVLLPQVHHEFLLWERCNKDAKYRMGCDGEIDDMLRIKLREAESNKEIFNSVAWIRAFNIIEPIYAELYH